MRVVKPRGSTADEQVESLEVDARELERDLSGVVDGEVRFDDGTRALYATDGSNYRQVPVGVVLPRSVDDVVATIETCRNHGAPVLGRGGGTSLAGQCCNVAVVLDFSKYMHSILDLDPVARTARVQPGLVLDRLRDEAEKHHLTFAPDPATHDHCTLGGMIGNNSCGTHSVMGGRTADNVRTLDVLTYDGLRIQVGPTDDHELDTIISAGGRKGEIYRRLRQLRDDYGDLVRKRYPDIPRRVSGYNLDELLPENGFNVARALVGTESTCVVVLEATCELVHSPPVRSLLVLGYADIYAAADNAPDAMAFSPTAVEGIDDRLIGFMKTKGVHPEDLELLPEGGGWLIVEFGGDSEEEADDKARELMEHCRSAEERPSMKLFDDPEQEAKVWEIRESALGATAFVPGEPPSWEGWEDAAVPPESLGSYLRDFRALLDRYDYGCSLYGHFGQGCIHTRIDFDFGTADGLGKFRSFIQEAADLVVSYGGSLSGEHGDGQSRAELLPKMFGDELVTAFREFKSIWDPQGKMNPGKVVEPYALDENLRLGTAYAPPSLSTHFKFVEEGGSFADAANRCVGIGKCRRESGGTMCPSYMVTREEMHSTRGRSRLLFEMLTGDPLTQDWRNEHVKEALDLCLACKGCKSDCPVNVDMATYKAEFLSHYYKRRLRPLSAYSMGLVYWWARIGSKMPRLVNSITRAPGLSRLVKRFGGIAQERDIPSFAGESFRAWWQRRPRRNRDMKRVLLWPDTFNNYFHPRVAEAAVEVIEHAGFQVTIPSRVLCCGRPLYDFGMLGLAKRLLRHVVDELRPEIRAGTLVVGLEPSCVAVFRDELTDLFPHDEDAKRLSRQFLTLAEWMDRVGYQLPLLEREALVQSHCHHKSVMGFDADEKVMGGMGLDVEVPDSGCCGMAGSFGFEKDKYEVSMKSGERVILPKVREASADTIIVADGFSCREQIVHATGREPHHLSEVVALALNGKSEKGAVG